MNRDNGTFLEDRMETLPLLEKYWAIDMEDITLLTSHLISSYHSRIVDVNGDMCLGKYTIPFLLRDYAFFQELTIIYIRHKL